MIPSFDRNNFRTPRDPRFMKTQIKFREVSKEASPGQLPRDLAHQVHKRAADERKSCSAVMTEIVCAAFQVDPRLYGLDAASPVEAN